VFLAGIVVVIYCSGQFEWPYGVQELAMLVLAAAAYVTTPRSNREANKFTFGPIIEVAVLFIGIFITMAPALQILNSAGSQERELVLLWIPRQMFWLLGSVGGADVLFKMSDVREPMHYFWA